MPRTRSEATRSLWHRRGGSALVPPQKRAALLRMLRAPPQHRHTSPEKEQAGQEPRPCRSRRDHSATWARGAQERQRRGESGARGHITGQHPALSTPQTPPAHICVELGRLPPVSPVPSRGKGSASPPGHPQQSPGPSPAPGKPVPAQGDGTCVHKTQTTEGKGLHRNTSAALNHRYPQSSTGTRGARRRPGRWEERSGRSEPRAAALCPAGRAPPPSPPAGLCLPSLLQPKTGTN